jgi:hypothetical protein
MKTNQPRQPIRKRRGWRILWILLALPLVPVLLWVVWNRFDEAPSAAALHFESIEPRPIADADNAWLLLAGIDAAEGSDPTALGRRRVDFLTDANRDPSGENADVRKALFAQALPEVLPDSKLDSSAELCPLSELNCLQWARTHRVMLERLKAANALRLTRYAAALQRPDWQALYPATMDAPVVSHPTSLHTQLLALALAEGGADSAMALDQLAANTAFWLRVRNQPQDLVAVLLSGRVLSRQYWLVNAWLDEASPAAIRSNKAALERALTAPIAAIDWERPVAHEYQIVSHTFRQAMPGLIGAVRQCITGATPEDSGCAMALAGNAGFAPNATMNLAAVHFQQMQRVLSATPAQLAQVSAEAGAVMEATFVQFDDIDVLLSQLAFNYTGRILAQIAVPAYDWGRREQDLEALRRMVLIKFRLRAEGIRVRKIEEFLARLPTDLHNPITAMPFNWDANTQQLSFEPMAPVDKSTERIAIRL